MVRKGHLAGVLLLAGILGILGCSSRPEAIASATWNSPNLLVNQADLDAIKKAVAQAHPVIMPAYQDLLRTADGMLSAMPQPIVGELKIPGYYTPLKDVQQRITRQLRNDARTAHALALAYALSGNTAYRDKAHDFIFAWVRSLTRPVNGGSWWQFYKLEHRGDTPLVVSYSFPSFIYAYDLLKGAGALTPDDVQAFRTWLAPFVEFLRSETLYKNNHHNWQVVFLLCAAHAMEDSNLFNDAILYYGHGLRGQIGSDGSLHRELWRKEKSGTYTLMALEGMTQAVQIALRHGHPELIQLQSRSGGTLEKALDFYIQFLNDPVSWAKYTNAKTLNRPTDRSDWGYIFELPYRWWAKPDYLPYLEKRPYGFGVERCYTLDFATLLFAQP